MRTEDLVDAIGAIDPVYVEEAEMWSRTAGDRGMLSAVREGILARRKILLPLAACLCLAAAGSAYGLFRSGSLFPGRGGMSGGAADGGGEERADAADVTDGADAGGAADAGSADTSGENGAAAGGAADAGSADPSGENGAAPAAGSADPAAGAGEGAEPEESGAANEDAQKSGAADMRIAVNEIEELQSALYCMPEPASVKHVMPGELEACYGTGILPDELPEGYELTDIPENGYEICYDGDGRLLDDHIQLSFKNRGADGAFTLSVRTTESGTVTSFAADDLAVSEICGNAVTIGHYTEGTGADSRECYLAVFEKQGVIFTVQSRQMEEEQFLMVLRELQ